MYYILELSCVEKLHLLSTSCTHRFPRCNILMHHQKDLQAFKHRAMNNRYTKQMHHISYGKATHTLPAYLNYIVWIRCFLCMGVRFRQRQEKQKHNDILHFSRSSFKKYSNASVFIIFPTIITSGFVIKSDEFWNKMKSILQHRCCKEIIWVFMKP